MRVVKGDEAPLGGVAQVVLHGVQVVEVSLQVKEHAEREKEKDGEVQVEVEREVEENQGETLIMDGMEMTVKGLKDDLSQCGVTRDHQRERTPKGALMCSLIHVAHVVLLCSCPCWCRWCHCCPHWS